MSNEPDSINDILDTLSDAGGHADEVTVGDITDALGHSGHAPFLIVPALIGATPIGGVPGVPTMLACVIAIFAVQMVLGLRGLWLPEVLKKRAVSDDKLQSAVKKLRPLADFLDGMAGARLRQLTQPPASRVAAGLCLALTLIVPPLEFVPFAVVVPMIAIALFGLALLARDGLLMCLALVGWMGAAYGAFIWLM